MFISYLINMIRWVVRALKWHVRFKLHVNFGLFINRWFLSLLVSLSWRELCNTTICLATRFGLIFRDRRGLLVSIFRRHFAFFIGIAKKSHSHLPIALRLIVTGRILRYLCYQSFFLIVTESLLGLHALSWIFVASFLLLHVSD